MDYLMANPLSKSDKYLNPTCIIKTQDFKIPIKSDNKQ